MNIADSLLISLADSQRIRMQLEKEIEALRKKIEELTSASSESASD